MRKKSLITMCILLIILSIGCTKDKSKEEIDDSKSKTEVESETDDNDNGTDAGIKMKEFTLKELAEYNGKDGNPAYVAVEGIVYDVSEVDSWKNGKHNGAMAGKDITKALLNDSPHGKSKLSLAEQVGILVDE